MATKTTSVGSPGPMSLRTLLKLYGIAIGLELGILLVVFVSAGGVGLMAAAIDPSTTTGTVIELRNGRIAFRYVVRGETFDRDTGLVVAKQSSNAKMQAGTAVRVDYWTAHPGFSCPCDARSALPTSAQPFDILIGAAFFLLIPIGFVTTVAFGLEQWRKALLP